MGYVCIIFVSIGYFVNILLYIVSIYICFVCGVCVYLVCMYIVQVKDPTVSCVTYVSVFPVSPVLLFPGITAFTYVSLDLCVQVIYKFFLEFS